MRRVSPSDPLHVPGVADQEVRTVARLLPYLWPKDRPDVRMRVVAAIVLLVGAKLATIVVPLFYRYAVDALSNAGGAAVVVPVGIVLAYGGARVLSQAFNELREIVFARVAHQAMHKVALETFQHLHLLSLRFHLDRQTGGLNRAIERGTAGIENLLHFMLFQVVPTLLEIMMVCGILWYLYDWRFAAVTFVTIGLYVAYTFAITAWRLRYRRAMLEAEGEASTKAIDSLLNYETVKYFGNEAHEARRFDRSLDAYERAAVLSKTSLSILNVGQGFVIAIGLTLVMLLAAFDVAAGAMTVGGFVMVNAYLIQLYLPLNFLGMVYREIRQALIDMQSMFKLLHANAEVLDSPGAVDLQATGGHVRFENVTFGYDPRRTILEGVDLDVPPGKTLAIVGASGAGKSTISRLLFRFYDVTDGAVKIDGQDLRDVTQASVRAAIGIVPQDTVLFNDTIFYNIAYGRPSATKEEVEEAAKLARIHDFVLSLPDGYATRVGERGLKLSGGERQRVSIARTILKRPKLLVFDEATSALDTRTEKAIQESLRQISAGVTTLTIAHRLSTVVDADQIVVLEKGRVVERGTHAGLLAADGVYAQMWRRQLETREALARIEAAASPGSGKLGDEAVDGRDARNDAVRVQEPREA
ncbi:MAG: ABC transporter ATP-binding protein/permease [Rhodospirillales bacterium]|nr:ABC transporter ATP-binding protein/permease [Rhodospirillales bacterium]